MLIIGLVSTKLPKKLRLFSLAIRIKNNIYYGQPNIQNYLPDWTSKFFFYIYIDYIYIYNLYIYIYSQLSISRTVKRPTNLFETSRVRLIE